MREIKKIDENTISIDGVIYTKKVIENDEPLICTINGYQFFLGPEYDSELEWEDAKQWCESLGDGYELPNRFIMLAMCMNEETAAKLSEYSYYWTSSEFEDDASLAWAQRWVSSFQGCQYYASKSGAGRVRAVRKVKVGSNQMNEQQRAAFEAWWESTPILKESKRTIAEKAYQVGRAAGLRDGRTDAYGSASRMDQMRDDGL